MTVPEGKGSPGGWGSGGGGGRDCSADRVGNFPFLELLGQEGGNGQGWPADPVGAGAHLESPSLPGDEATLAHSCAHGGSILGLGKEAPRDQH